jgi:hypothetical protein
VAFMKHPAGYKIAPHVHTWSTDRCFIPRRSF